MTEMSGKMAQIIYIYISINTFLFFFILRNKSKHSCHTPDYQQVILHKVWNPVSFFKKAVIEM
jgi:hypothetical protein